MISTLAHLIIGATTSLVGAIGLTGLFWLALGLWLLAHGGKAILPWAKGVRDLTLAGAMFAGLLRLALGPRWQRYVAGAALLFAWWFTLTRFPGVRLPLLTALTLGALVAFEVAAAMMARRHNLRHLPPLRALLEGYRLEHTGHAVSDAVKTATHRTDDETRIVRWVEVLPDRIRAGIEPCPGQSVGDIATACAEGRVGPQVTRALRAQGMPVPAHAAQAKVTGEHEGAVVVEIMTVAPRQKIDLGATVWMAPPIDWEEAS